MGRDVAVVGERYKCEGMKLVFSKISTDMTLGRDHHVRVISLPAQKSIHLPARSIGSICSPPLPPQNQYTASQYPHAHPDSAQRGSPFAIRESLCPQRGFAKAETQIQKVSLRVQLSFFLSATTRGDCGGRGMRSTADVTATQPHSLPTTAMQERVNVRSLSPVLRLVGRCESCGQR